MIASAPLTPSDGSPRWLWVMAILTGPVLLAFLVFQFLNIVPYDDVISCGPAVHPLQGGLLGLIVLQAPTALVLFAGLVSRSNWRAPVIMSASCGAAMFLFFVAYSLHPPWPTAIDCSDFSAIIRRMA